MQRTEIVCAIKLRQAQKVIDHFLHRLVVAFLARCDHTKQSSLCNIFGIVLLVTMLSFREVVLQVAVTLTQEIPNIYQMGLHLACVGSDVKSGRTHGLHTLSHQKLLRIITVRYWRQP